MLDSTTGNLREQKLYPPRALLESSGKGAEACSDTRCQNSLELHLLDAPPCKTTAGYL